MDDSKVNDLYEKEKDAIEKVRAIFGKRKKTFNEIAVGCASASAGADV